MRSSNYTDSPYQHQHSQTRSPIVTQLSKIFQPRMTVFNIVRACLYSVVLLWSIICLAVAVHFKRLLLTSDLTRFVPFAIFVCTAGLCIIVLLLGFSIRKKLNPISTRIELGFLGLAGTFWLALGSFLATSDLQNADVECFESATSTVPLDPSSFSTETYHAQYRVLEAFSLFNAILIWGFLLLLLCLAIRQHFQGETLVWYCPVTVYPWFNTYSKHSPKLPSPVTAQREKGLSRGRSYDEKEYGYDDYERRPSRNSPRHGERGRTEWNQQRPPARAHTTDRYKEYPTHIHDKFARGASPRR
jgi:hypothetical protein